MFNVSWSTPTETVASHRTKKAITQPSLRSAPGHGSSLVSSASSSSSLKPPSRGFSALGGIFKGDKRIRGKYVDRSDTASIASSQPSTTTIATDTTERSLPEESDDEEHVEDGNLQHSLAHRNRATASYQSSVHSDDSASSTFSTWGAASSAYSHPIDITAKHEFQEINRHSFVMRSTEITITANSVDGLQGPMQEVHISSNVPNQYLDTDTDASPIRKSSKPSGARVSSKSASKGKPRDKKRPEGLTIASSGPPELQSWQPPSNWACLRSPTSTTPSTSRRGAQLSTHHNHLIKRMAAASPKIMLERLTEEWSQDPVFHHDVMFEKQLWLLTALGYLQRGGKAMDLKRKEESDDDAEDCRVLSLFEGKASFTYNVTFQAPPALPLHHPIPATTDLPFPGELFDTITSMPLPTLFPADRLPHLLRECHRILRPGGTIKLFLLDATPAFGTMGTLLKAWLSKHVMVNIEKRGRAREVHKEMGMWLVEAGFMGGDGEVRISFRAAEHDFPVKDKEKSKSVRKKGSKAKSTAKKEVDEEQKDVHRLSVLVGRMLWKELWGPFVGGRGWWWDDEAIVEECKALGTKWEGIVVEAVKRS